MIVMLDVVRELDGLGEVVGCGVSLVVNGVLLVTSDLVMCSVLSVILSLFSCNSWAAVLSSKYVSMSLPHSRSMSSVSIGVTLCCVIPLLVCPCCSL